MNISIRNKLNNRSKSRQGCRKSGNLVFLCTLDKTP